MSHLKSTFVTVALILLQIALYAQETEKDTIWVPVRDYSAIKEGNYYQTHIKKIQRVKNGYILSCFVNANNRTIPVWVVVPTGDLVYKGKAIRKQSELILSFKKYNSNYLGHLFDYENTRYIVGDSFEEVLDILEGDKVVSVQETDLTKYYFVSLDIGRWFEIDGDSIAYYKEKKFQEEALSIRESAQCFIKQFVFAKKWNTYICNIDTNKFNHCLSHWSKPSYYRDFDKKNISSKWSLPKYDWQGYKKFSDRMSHFQKLNSYPVSYEDSTLIAISDMQLLYARDNWVTIRVYWAIQNKEHHTIIMTLRKDSGCWRVCGVVKNQCGAK